MSLTIALPLPTNLLTNLVPVNKVGDFGTPVDGVITLEDGKRYILNKSITTSDRFVIPTGGNVTIESIFLFTFNLSYTGSDTLFTADGMNSLVFKNIIVNGNSLATLYNLDNGGFLRIELAIFVTWLSLGRASTLGFNVDQGEFDFYDEGLTFSSRTDAGERRVVLLDNCFVGTNSTNVLTTFDFPDGDLTLAVTVIGGALSIAGSNQTLFNFSDALKLNGIPITVRNFLIEDEPLAIFTPNSLKQDYIRSVFTGNFGIQSSTAIIKLSLTNNTAITTISTQNENTIINTNVLWSIDDLIERYLVQDLCTFDNTGNTVDITFNHGISDNDRIFLFTYTGTLPAELDADTEYHVVNKNAADFQVSLTQGGSVVTFTDNGSGTLFYRHNTGVTVLAQMIYTGIETIKCRADGWETLESTTGTKINVKAVIMKINTDGTIIEDQIAAPVSVNSSESGVSQISNVATLSTGEGNVIYHSNDSDTTNIVGKDLLISLNKVT